MPQFMIGDLRVLVTEAEGEWYTGALEVDCDLGRVEDGSAPTSVEAIDKFLRHLEIVLE